MKRLQVIRTAMAAVAVFGMAASTLRASPGDVLSQDEMARVWGATCRVDHGNSKYFS